MTRTTNKNPRGFTFAEVLFATMILGIGLIMVAGMLPVGIKLTQTTAENATASNVGKNAVQMLTQSCKTTMLTTAGKVEYTSAAFLPVNGSRIVYSDPRFAWVPVYKWDGVSPGTIYAYVFVAKSRRDDTYTSNTASTNNTLNADLIPKKIVGVKFYNNGGTTPDRIEFPNFSGSTPNRRLIGEGAYVVISNYTPDPTVNGQIYRVGQPVDEANGIWELLVGFDLQRPSIVVKPTNIATPPDVYVLGKQLTNPATAFNDVSNPLTGPVQDVGIFQSTITLP